MSSNVMFISCPFYIREEKNFTGRRYKRMGTIGTTGTTSIGTNMATTEGATATATVRATMGNMMRTIGGTRFMQIFGNMGTVPVVNGGKIINALSSCTRSVDNVGRSFCRTIANGAKSVALPFIITRPEELVLDMYPLTSDTDRCSNFVKRMIRNSVWNNDAENGVISFSIDPRDAYFVRSIRVDNDSVVGEVSTWLERTRDSLDTTGNWPKKISWIGGKRNVFMVCYC
jgi:hypothetical protein